MSATKESTEKMTQDQQIEFNELVEKFGFEKAIKEMNTRIGFDNQLIDISYSIKSFQNEGAYALSLAVERVLGRFDMETTEGMSGSNPPTMINVDLPNGESVKVPWGRIALPGFDKDCYIDINYDYYYLSISVNARIRKRDEVDIKKVIKETEKILKEESIYKGQAIELNFDEEEDAVEPTFMDLSNISENKILFSKDINDGLIPVLARIKQTAKCRQQGLDIKLGVLMEGPYGTGKTLTAFWLGKIAKEYGWTFIYLKDCRYTAKALKIAENYARKNNGVILFSEDIDQIIKGKRGQEIQDIVNTLDGGDTKSLPIISMFTTNHIEVIDPTFLRGKRIGSLIQFGVLDMDTAKQFIDKLVVDKDDNSLMSEGDHTEAYKSLCGIVPAFASEVIDKAKAYMIHRGANKISTNDIVYAAESYKKQIEYAKCIAIDTKAQEIPNALKVLGDNLFPITKKKSGAKLVEDTIRIYNYVKEKENV